MTVLNFMISSARRAKLASDPSTVFLIPAKDSSKAIADCAAFIRPTEIVPIPINAPAATEACIAVILLICWAAAPIPFSASILS